MGTDRRSEVCSEYIIGFLWTVRIAVEYRVANNLVVYLR
jgi:hypothetical protein